MIKNKSKSIYTLIALLSITLFIINPSSCMDATTNGLKVWLINVVPALFPFFILTRIISTLNQTSITALDKFTNRFFKTNNAGLVYFLSMLSGYPVGAKIIGNYYNMGVLDKSTASKMFSFCSTSGPMFIVGTVGIGVFGNASVGYILLVGHIMGGFFNGILYRNKPTSTYYTPTKTVKTSLNDIVYDSIISILLVGGYIVFASVIIELLTITNILPALASTLSKIPYFNYDAVYGFLCGIIEITNGLIYIGGSSISITSKIIISSIIISFSGICILLQSLAFLNKTGISKRTMIQQKLTQTLFSMIFTCLIVFITNFN